MIMLVNPIVLSFRGYRNFAGKMCSHSWFHMKLTTGKASTSLLNLVLTTMQKMPYPWIDKKQTEKTFVDK